MADIFKINDAEFECEFKLTNSDGQEVKFTKSAVKGMTLVDNIFEPFESGTISIANPYDFVENKYFIRGDGRDKFKIMFKAKDGKKEKYENTFCITSDDNAGYPDNRLENIKTFNLVDAKVLPFLEKIPYAKTFSGKVGDILKDIFKELLGEDKIGDWESGDFELSYIPPLNWRYIDLVYYLLRVFYAKADDIYVKAFLQWDHSKEKFNLQLISKLFEDNKKKENLMDAFAIGDLTSEFDPSNPNNPPADAETGTYIGGSRNIGYSTPSHDITNNFFVNRIVHGYDPILGETKIKKIDIKKLKDKWKKKFVDVFSSIGGKPKPCLVFNNTLPEKFKHYRMPFQIEDSVKIIEAEMNAALIFYNLQATFVNLGDTFRQSGKFIDIYKTKKEQWKSDEKLLGRWLVTEIQHIFYADLYRNQFFCTKTYIGPTSNVSDDAE
jgi:hypothetical protein